MPNPVISTSPPSKILGCASQGSGSPDEARLVALLANFQTSLVPFDRRRKKDGFLACLRAMKKGGFDLFVMEGTGIASGLAAILGSLLYKRRYVLSSGDAVGPFLSAATPLGAPLFGAYERLLYRRSSGFIGWTPYLVGRALTLGAKRGVTIPGWAPYLPEPGSLAHDRIAIREKLGIPQDAIVFGIVGSLPWNTRYQYCYGSELVRAAGEAKTGAYVVVVGDGSGLPRMKEMAGAALGRTIFFPGRVPREEVPAYLAAMDVGSLPQSVDAVGSFRYTTKIAEYRATGLPFVTNQIPMGYDLDRGDIWRLEGENPWSPRFISALARLMSTLTREDLAPYKSSGTQDDLFDRDTQIARVTAFLQDILSNITSR